MLSATLSFLSSPSERALSAGAGILISVLLAWGLPRAVDKMLNDYPWDGFVDWTSAQSFWAHENPYDATVMLRHDIARFGGVGHPPTTAFWFLPFAALSLNGMSTSLGIIVLGMLFVQLFIICRELGLPRPLLFASTWYALTVPAPWFFWHISLAQVSVPIAFFVVIGWYCLRHGRDVSAGVSLGLAASFKLFPGVLMLFLLVTGRVRAFLASVIAFGTVAALMTARFGADAWFMFFVQQREIGRQWIGHIRNRSFHGIVLRLLAPDAPSAVPTRCQSVGVDFGRLTHSSRDGALLRATTGSRADLVRSVVCSYMLRGGVFQRVGLGTLLRASALAWGHSGGLVCSC